MGDLAVVGISIGAGFIGILIGVLVVLVICRKVRDYSIFILLLVSLSLGSKECANSRIFLLITFLDKRGIQKQKT